MAGSPSGFSRSGSPHEKLRFCLRYAILAPSPFNAQPWLFRPTPRRDATAVDTPPPSAALLEALAGCARTHAAWLRFADTRRSWRALIRLVCDGELRQRADARFQADLAREPFRDGISTAGPANSAGFGDFVAPGWSQTVGTTQPARQRSIWIAREPMPVPVFAVLGTQGDSSADWIAAGQAMMHRVLRARGTSVRVTDFNQPLRVEALRSLVRGALAASGFAQALLRIDHGVQVEPMHRRDLEDMLLLPANGRRSTP